MFFILNMVLKVEATLQCIHRALRQSEERRCISDGDQVLDTRIY